MLGTWSLTEYHFFDTQESGNGRDRSEFCNPLNSVVGQRNWIRGSIEKYAKRTKKDGCSKKEAKLYIERCFEKKWEEAGEPEELPPELKEELKALLTLTEEMMNDQNRQVRQLGEHLKQPVTAFLERRNYSFENTEELKEKLMVANNENQK